MEMHVSRPELHNEKNYKYAYILNVQAAPLRTLKICEEHFTSAVIFTNFPTSHLDEVSSVSSVNLFFFPLKY